MNPVGNFVVIDSIHGRFILNRHCDFQAESLIKTGQTHIEDELAKIFVIVDRLSAGAVIVDGGANAGFFTVPVANRTRGRDITIYSFEPQRSIFQGLAGSLALNDLDHVVLYNMALGDRAGFVALPDVDYGRPQDFGMVQIESDPVEIRNLVNPRQAEIITLDSLDLPRLDFIKLDVEGFECAAIQGGLKSIKKHRPWIWVEYFITGFNKIKACLDVIDGYEFHVMDYQNMLCVPVEKAQAQGIVINK